MKIYDIFKFALNNIFNSKSRTILTSIIVFIVGTLIMSILVITINFSTNLNMLQTKVMENVDSKIVITKYSYNNYDEKVSEYLNTNDIEKILNVTDSNSDIVNSLEIESANSNFYYHRSLGKINTQNYNDYNNFYVTTNEYKAKFMSFNFSCPYSIIYGRYWTKDDVNTNNIWVTRNFVDREIAKGNFVDIDSTIYLQKTVFYYDEITRNYIEGFYSTEYVVKGIIENVTYGRYVYDFIIDIKYANNNYNSFVLNSYVVSTNYRNPKGSYNFSKVYSKTDKLKKVLLSDLNTIGKVYEVKSTLLEDMKLMRLIGVGVTGIGFIIGSIIILLSVGSIGNTIIISADKNKKFFGLLKAIGLKKKDMINIIQVESGITIGVGIGLSSLLIILMKNDFINLLDLIFGSFSYEMSFTQYDLVFSLPFYLPVFVIMAFLGLGFLFSRTSLLEIANMDAISIISEVS